MLKIGQKDWTQGVGTFPKPGNNKYLTSLDKFEKGLLLSVVSTIFDVVINDEVQRSNGSFTTTYLGLLYH